MRRRRKTTYIEFGKFTIPNPWRLCISCRPIKSLKDFVESLEDEVRVKVVESGKVVGFR